MRVSKEHKEKIRDAILQSAAGGFREKGYDGLGVDGLAKAAGMTSGAFYGHFSSKEEAFKNVLEKGLHDYGQAVKRFQEQYGPDWVRAFLDFYLGDEHLGNLACSCVVPGLSADVMRGGGDLKQLYAQGVSDISKKLSDGLDKSASGNVWAVMSMLAGAVMMARSVSDEKLVGDIITSARLWAEKMLEGKE